MLRNYQPVAWVLYQRVIDQSKADILIKPGLAWVLNQRVIDQTKADIFIKPGITYPGLIKMSAFDWSMTRWYKTHATGW
jgi:hypothetical protein